MATLEIPDEIYETLAERAHVHGRTVTEEAVALLREVPDQMDHDKYLKLLERIRALPKFKSDLDPVALIREDRDSR